MSIIHLFTLFQVIVIDCIRCICFLIVVVVKINLLKN